MNFRDFSPWIGVFSLLLIQNDFVSADLRTDLLPQCKSMATNVDKSECRPHYFIFVFVLLAQPSYDDAQNHLYITQQILRSCYELEKGQQQKSLVTFADHDWKIDQAVHYDLGEIMELTNISAKYDYIFYTKDVSSTNDLQEIMKMAINQMTSSSLDVQYSVLILLHSYDWELMNEYGQSLENFGKGMIQNFVDNKIVAKLIFTVEQTLQPGSVDFLDRLIGISQGYFSYDIDKMSDPRSIAAKYGMCTDYREPKRGNGNPLALWIPLAAVGGTLILSTVTCIVLAWFGVLNAPARRLHDFLETKLNVTVNWLDVEDGENMFGSAGRIKRVNDDWEIDPLTLHVSNNKLGSGAYASVYSATLSGLPPIVKVFPKLQEGDPLFNGGDNTIAVKSPHVHISPAERREFFREIAFMKNLDYHPHLLCMLGCSTDPKTPMILLELCEIGDLHSIVKKLGKIEKKDKVDEIDIEKAKNGIQMEDLVAVIWQVADALVYLVDKQIIHRDIAARNVLLNAEKVAKLSDFGLCRQSDEMWYSSRGGKLPLRWMAPESIEMAAFSASTDIWSFGVLLWEAYSYGTVPFPTVATEDVLSHLKKGNRLEAPDNAPPFMAALMESCWEWDPSLRPTAEKARAILQEQLEAQGITVNEGARMTRASNHVQEETIAEIAEE